MDGRSPIPHPANWRVARLGEIATKIGSGATPRGGGDSYLLRRENFALVRSQNVYDRHFDGTGLAFISDEQAAHMRTVRLQPGDLLLNITGDGVTFARACAVPTEILPACVNQHVAIVRVDEKAADPGYVLSYLTHPRVKAYIESFNAGGSRRAITKGHIESFLVPLPPLPEQRAIANILTTLDKKIEFNRRVNSTLEAMGRALFKSWFVDFDPVRPNANRPAPLAGLFPDRFEDSAVGEIPMNWKFGQLGDVADHSRRGVRPDEIEMNTPYIALEHMPRRSIALPEWDLANDFESNKFRFKRGEILFGKLRPYFHKVGVAPVDGVCSTDIVVVQPKNELWFSFVLAQLSSDVFIEYVNSGSTGTKMPRTSWNEMARYSLVLPPERIAAAFNAQVRTAVDRIMSGIHESRTLAALRDTLLPKLISGELRIKDAERFLEGTMP